MEGSYALETVILVKTHAVSLPACFVTREGFLVGRRSRMFVVRDVRFEEGEKERYAKSHGGGGSTMGLTEMSPSS